MGLRIWSSLGAALIILSGISAIPGNSTTRAQAQFTISGRVTEPPSGTGIGISGVTVTLTLNSSTQTMTTTDSGGNFSFQNIPAGSNYDVTPSKPNHTFHPASRGGTNLQGDLQGDLGLFFERVVSGGANPIDQSDFFVRQHYTDFFNRQADSSGLAFWTNNIESCGSNAACREVKRIDTSAAFFLSIEFQETGYLVYRLYKAAYGDLAGAPFPVRRAEFISDTRVIGSGVVVGQTGWEQVLENNKQSFVGNFVTTTRFTNAHPTTTTPTQFVDTLFARAGFTPPALDRQAAIAEFGTAPSSADPAARARALRRVAEHSLLRAQEFNRAFVLMQYFGYLQRNPDDAPDNNLAGYNFWLDKLNLFNGDFRQAEMVKAFITSSEYRQRFGP